MDSDNKDAPDGGIKMKICFIIFGIGSLLAWNAILSDISFFMNYQGKYDPSTWFSFCNFLLNIIFQFIMIWKRQFMSYKVELIIGLIASIVSIVVLPIVVLLFEKNSLTGFIVTAGIVLLLGLVNALCTSGFFGLTSFFPREMIISFSTGQGLSGILLNLIGYVVLLSVNTGDKDKDAKLGAVIYFSISGFMLLLTLFILFLGYRTEYFKHYLGKTKEYDPMRNTKIENEIANEPITTPSVASENKGENLVQQLEPEVKKEGEITFKQLFQKLYEIDLLSCYIYVITFTLFPAVSISQRLFKTGKYRQLTIITTYNVGDTIGRSIISGCKFTKNLAYIIICGRSILVVTLILNFYFDMRMGLNPIASSILLLVNVTALAVTNGIGTTVCLGLAPTMVPGPMKGRAGSSIGFFNIMGIFLGSCIAFMSKYIINQIGVYVEEQ